MAGIMWAGNPYRWGCLGTFDLLIKIAKMSKNNKIQYQKQLI